MALPREREPRHCSSSAGDWTAASTVLQFIVLVLPTVSFHPITPLSLLPLASWIPLFLLLLPFLQIRSIFPFALPLAW